MRYDVLIVGARVAGSSLALALARRGHGVILVDREEFPSDTLSTHFMSAGAVGGLARLGVLADVEAAGFRRVACTRTWIDDCCLEGPAGPAGSYGTAGTCCVSCSRPTPTWKSACGTSPSRER